MTACPPIQPAQQQANLQAQPQVHTLFEPHPRHWKQLLQSHAKARITTNDKETTRTREQLGLPTNKPIVLTGHQPGFHHAGIAAKAFAAAQLAESANAQAVWIVVDHDSTDPLSLNLPAGNTRIPPTNATNNAHLAPRQRQPVNTKPAQPNHASPASTAANLLSRHATAPSLAIQSARAFLDHLHLLHRFIILPASELTKTDRFQQLTAQLVAKTFPIITAYNAAAAAHPQAKIRPLLQSTTAWFAELPLWKLPPNQPRQPVTLDEAQHWFDYKSAQPTDLFKAIRDQLAPRAIFMTLLCRLDIADLFIHGQGGHTYEQVTDHWHKLWNPSPTTPLAPVTLATADAYPTTPTITNTKPLTQQQAAEQHTKALWLARAATHNPNLLSDTNAQHTKQSILDQIRTSKQTLGRGNPQTAALHRNLREHLQTYRAANADKLAKLQSQTRGTRQQLTGAISASDRTISTLALPPSTLAELEQAVSSAFNTPTP